MATLNPFDLLGDDDNDDPSVLIAAQQQKVAAAVAATAKKPTAAASQPPKAAKLPTKPPPPAQSVREARSEGGRGGGRGGGGRGFGRPRGGYNRDSGITENTYGNDGEAPANSRYFEDGKPSDKRPLNGARGGYRGGRRGGFTNGEIGDGEKPRRTYDRHSGTGRSNEPKRDGAGRGNWGTVADEIAEETQVVSGEGEADVTAEKPVNEEENSDANKENPANDTEEKEPEEKQMTLEEYEKVLEEKRKALQAMKVEERKVDAKEFESMQVISKKKSDEEVVFIKLGSDKDKRKEAADREERAKKSVSINAFLKPAEGESYYRSGGRGRGRGRGGSRGGYGGGRGYGDVQAPSIADPGQFPSLGSN